MSVKIFVSREKLGYVRKNFYMTGKIRVFSKNVSISEKHFANIPPPSPRQQFGEKKY